MSIRGLILLPLLLAAQGLAAEDLRHLTSELGCTACHQAPSAETYLQPKRGPILDAVGSRLKPDWIRAFLADPSNTTMPNMVAHLPEAEQQETIENLTHYLLSDGGKKPTTPSNAHPIGGAQLHKTIGCAACHGGDPPDLSQKYTFGSLTHFLLDPLATRPDGRMPAMHLSRDEAADIAAYWLDLKPQATKPDRSSPFQVDASRATAGKAAFESLQCAACHTRKGTKTPPLARSIFTPAPDCQGPPRYNLTTAQKATLTTTDTPLPFDPHTRLQANLEAFKCNACHESDDPNLFTGDPLLGDAGRFPPTLTDAGRKLRSTWITQVLEGKKRYRAYLDTRMPLYGMANVGHLPDLFAQAHQAPEFTHPPENHLTEGHQLVGTSGGMGCITCHAWQENLGVAMHGPSISAIGERLHFDWFKAYLIDPQRIRPNTLMPSFWPEGKSGNPNVLDGNTNHQIAAIWTFLNKGTETPAGIPNPGSQEFEILPADKPIVQRGFMHHGTRLHTSAIAVGFPNKTNFLYDAATSRPIVAWKGRFLDGYPLWFSRMDPSVTLPEHAMPIPAAGPDAKSPRRFKGYRFDPNSGLPTFLSETETSLIEEQIHPDLQRTLIITQRDKPNTRQEFQSQIKL